MGASSSMRATIMPREYEELMKQSKIAEQIVEGPGAYDFVPVSSDDESLFWDIENVVRRGSCEHAEGHGIEVIEGSGFDPSQLFG